MGHRYVIRKATEDDCEAIFRLIMELAVFEKAPEQVKNTVEDLKKDGFGEKSFFNCIVAETSSSNGTIATTDESTNHINGTMATEDESTNHSNGTMATKDESTNHCNGKVVIGFALYFFGYSTWNGRLVYLEDIYVTQAHRGLKRDGFGEKSFFSCLVAETDEDESSSQGKVVIGYAMYYFGYSTWSGRLVYLEDLCVASGHRGAGVGTALMKRVAGIGAEVGCVRLQFVVLGWNTGARKLYDRQGAQDLTESEDWHVSTIRNETFIKVAKDSTNTSNDHIRIIA